MIIGTGIFMWSGTERQSRRYGAFYLAHTNYRKTVTVEPRLDVASLRRLCQQRVRITVKVTKARNSGHAGDAFLDLKPSKPKIGEVIDLGVGILDTGCLSYEPKTTTIILQPETRRDELWLDPRKLFRLHDQTVEVEIEPTTDACSPKPDLTFKAAGAVVNADGKTIQFSGVLAEDVKAVRPPRVHFENLGGGAFTMSFEDPQPGDRLKPILK